MNNQVLINLDKILKDTKHKKFSLINISPKDVYEFENFREHFKDQLDNAIIVGSKNMFTIPRKNIKVMSYKIFNDKKEEFYTNSRNGIVVWNLRDNEEFNLEGLQAYYPVIFLIGGKLKLENDDDWKIFEFTDEKLTILVNRNIENFPSFLFKNFNISADIREVKEVKVVENLTVESFVNYSIFDNLPKPTVFPDRKNGVFLKEFYNYILEILKIIVPKNKEKLIPYILNKQTMKDYWIKAFTHFTTEPDVNENYESLEKLGDKVLKFSFMEYYMDRFPYAEPGELNNAEQFTQSNSEQIKLGKSMGVLNWAQIEEPLRINQKINEDILEAFAGALDKSLNSQGIVGVSVAIIINMFKLLFDSFSFDVIDINAPTWINQFIDRITPGSFKNRNKYSIDEEEDNIRKINLPRPNAIDSETYNEILEAGNEILIEKGIEGILVDKIQTKGVKKDTGIIFEITETNNRKIKCQVILNAFGAKVLNYYGFNLKANQVLGEDIQTTKPPAKAYASGNAKKFLKKLGITNTWVAEQSENKSIEDFKDLQKDALLKAKRLHSDIIKIGIKSKTILTMKIFLLYGENNNGYKYRLESYVSDNKPANNYKIIVEKFLGLN
jgi:dsRNA-specific ribonuclease